MSFSTTSSARFHTLSGLAPGPTDNCTTTTTLRYAKPAKNNKLSKKRRRRPVSAVQGAADSAPVSTSFGAAGRGNASHWNWVKSGKRPPKELSALEHKRNKDLKKKHRASNAAAATTGPVGPETNDENSVNGNPGNPGNLGNPTEHQLRKKLFQKPRKHPSLYDRTPIDVENYICSHAHVGNKYYGSFGFRQGKSSLEGSFSKSGRNDQWRMPTAANPGPNQYGDVDVGFSKVGQTHLNKAVRVKQVRKEQCKTNQFNKAVASLKDPLPGELYKTIVMKNSKKGLLVSENDPMKKKDAKYLLATLEKTGLVPLLSNQTNKHKSKSKTNSRKKMNRKVRSLSVASLQSNFASPGLGGTESRFARTQGTYKPGPGHYGDVDSFAKPKSKPHTSTTRPHSAMAALSPILKHRNRDNIALADRTAIPKGGTFHTQVSKCVVQVLPVKKSIVFLFFFICFFIVLRVSTNNSPSKLC